MLKEVTKTDTGDTTVILTGKAYDRGKKLVQVVLPASASFYFGLSQIWGFPAGEEVVGSIALLTTFLGAVLGISSNRYQHSEAAHDGQMIVTQDPGGVKNFSLELDGDPETLVDKESISFRIKKKYEGMPKPPA